MYVCMYDIDIYMYAHHTNRYIYRYADAYADV